MAAKKQKSIELLKKLATDDKLREEMTKDPLRVLREHGIEVSEKDWPKQVKLPDKEDLEKNFDQYVEEIKERDGPEIFKFKP